MTSTAHSFIRIFQSLPLVEQNSVMVRIENRKDFIENGVIDEAFSPMTSAEQQSFWQKMNVEHLFKIGLPKKMIFGQIIFKK